MDLIRLFNHMSTLTVHPLSKYPDEAWCSMEKIQRVIKLNPAPLDTPIKKDYVRFVCISDTHSRIHQMRIPIPAGDVLLHAGDITNYGDDKELIKFNSFLETLPHKYKIVIAGNHDHNLHEIFKPNIRDQVGQNNLKITCELTESAKLLTSAIYLQDSSTSVYGIKIYGSPWQPVHCPGAFSINRGDPLLKIWNLIPGDTDILLTHTPPLGHGDLTKRNNRAGCVDLLSTVKNRVKPRYHVFGHIHEG
ncbi:hypothetical protein CHUAL_004478 [Chamberlinius hualienensis]